MNIIEKILNNIEINKFFLSKLDKKKFNDFDNYQKTWNIILNLTLEEKNNLFLVWIPNLVHAILKKHSKKKINKLRYKFNLEIKFKPIVILDYLKHYISLQNNTNINIVFFIWILKRVKTLYLNTNISLQILELDEILKKMKLNLNHFKFKKMKKQKIQEMLQYLKNKIYTKKEIILFYQKMFPKDIVKERPFFAIVERITKGLYYYDRKKFIKINESNYEKDKIVEFFKQLEKLLLKKYIISKRFLIKDFSNFFYNGQLETMSEYFIHFFLKKKYTGLIIEFNRMPIISIRNKKQPIANKQKVALLSVFINGMTKKILINKLEEHFGFNKAYSLNLISFFCNGEQALILQDSNFKLWRNYEQY